MPLNKIELSLSTLIISNQLLLVITALTIVNAAAAAGVNFGVQGHESEAVRQSARSDDDDDDDDGKIWKIIGIIVGIVCFAIILIVIYVCVVVRRRHKKNGKKWFWTRNSEIKSVRNNSRDQNANQQSSTGSPPPPRQSQQIDPGSLTRATAPQVTMVHPNGQMDDRHQAPPSFNPNFVSFDGSYIFVDDELPPPYDFREISVHPSAPPESMQFRNENERQRSVQTTEL